MYEERKRYGILIEIMVFTIILIIINYLFFPNDIGFHKSKDFNPSLLLFLLIVSRYGTRWGYCALAISVCYYMFPPPYGKDFFMERLPSVSLFFILFIVFGAIQSKYAVKLKNLEEKLDEQNNINSVLNERYKIASFLKENYEKKLLTQAVTMADLYGDARNMQILNVEELYREVHKILQRYIETEKSSLYILDNNILKLKSYLGYGEGEKPREEINISESPYNVVLKKKIPVRF